MRRAKDRLIRRLPEKGLEKLLESLRNSSFVPKRNSSTPFVFAVDHCFAIKGQGTILTGTVLQGMVQINDTVEIPALKENRKVKSMQMFRQPVEGAAQGDRLGICVTQFDPKLLERGLVCAPGYVPTVYAAVASVNKIRFFSGKVATKSKFHISLGHETLLAKVTFFNGATPFDLSNTFQYQDELQQEGSTGTCFLLIEFERPVAVIPNCLLIGSKLDMDVHTSTCRLAFWGNLLLTYDMKNYTTAALPSLKIYKNKSKAGVIERAKNPSSLVVKNIFKKETNLEVFTGMKVKLSTGEGGVIEGGFGQSGKITVNIPGGLSDETYKAITAKKEEGRKPIQVTLDFKKFIYDPQKKMIQV
ncbi:hypothetical protein B566_EDAN016515 [Ephemera danica]|nr:hypothetical protein B566_EDAN016515 [Ephemera danica]